MNSPMHAQNNRNTYTRPHTPTHAHTRSSFTHSLTLTYALYSCLQVFSFAMDVGFNKICGRGYGDNIYIYIYIIYILYIYICTTHLLVNDHLELTDSSQVFTCVAKATERIALARLNTT